MKTVIRKKGVNVYRWHLMDQYCTVESGTHVGALADLQPILKEKRAKHMAEAKRLREAATAKRRAEEAANPRTRRYNIGRPRKQLEPAPAPPPAISPATADSVDNADL